MVSYDIVVSIQQAIEVVMLVSYTQGVGGRSNSLGAPRPPDAGALKKSRGGL